MAEKVTEDKKETTAAPHGGNGHLSSNGSSNVEDKQQVAVETDEVNDAAETGRKRNRLPLYIAAGVVLIGAIAGLFYWLYTRQFEYTDDAFIDGEIVQISPRISTYVTKVHVKENQFVKKGDLLVELNADDQQAKLESAKSQLRAAQAERVRAQAKTNLTRSTSQADQYQARSNVDTARTNVSQSGLTAEVRRAEIQQAKSGVSTARANLDRAKAMIPNAEANLKYAQVDFERNLSLFNHGSVSRQSLELSENALERAKAELTAARNQVKATESMIEEADARVRTAENNYKQSLSQIDASRSEVEESIGRLRSADSVPEKIAVDQSEVGTADAGISRAEAEVQAAELELSNTKIFAPQDGFVTRKNVHEGQLVQPGSALFAISQPEVWIIANFKETQLERLRVGQVVDLKVDAYPGKTFYGRIESFQAGTGSALSVLPSENSTGNFVKVVQRVPVKIVFEKKPDDIHLLVPGMSVQPRVRVQ